MATTKEEIGAASLSPDHLEYRRICAEIDTFEQPAYRGDEAGDAALGCLLGEADAIAERVWAKPAETLGDVLLRGEIALRKTEAGDNLHCPGTPPPTSRSSASGASARLLFPPGLIDEEWEILSRIRAGDRIEHYETVRRRKDGSLVDVSLTVSPLRNAAGKVTGVIKIARDITARKKAEHERLHAIQDDERRRIADDLHDSTAQHLLAINLHLMRIRQGAALGAETLRILDVIDDSLEEATKELSAFTYLLHPPDLQRDGLSATLCRYAEGFGRRTGLKISVRLCRGLDQLQLALQQTLLRIVQEALTNVYRHASATRVSYAAPGRGRPDAAHIGWPP